MYNYGMVIYVECVLINNIAIDILMGYLTLLTCRRKVVWWRLLLVGIIGGDYALLTPLIEFKGDIVLKIAVALLLCLLLASPLNVKKYLSLVAVFFGYSFAFGGLLIALMNMWQPLSEVLSSPNNINVGLGATLFLLITISARKVLQIILKHKNREGNVKKVIINTESRVIKEKGYYDSGNTLYYRGIYPVIVIDESLEVDGTAVGAINVDTIAGGVSKKVYKIGKIMIENRSYDSVYCIFNKLNNGYKVLLHNETY